MKFSIRQMATVGAAVWAWAAAPRPCQGPTSAPREARPRARPVSTSTLLLVPAASSAGRGCPQYLAFVFYTPPPCNATLCNGARQPNVCYVMWSLCMVCRVCLRFSGRDPMDYGYRPRLGLQEPLEGWSGKGVGGLAPLAAKPGEGVRTRWIRSAGRDAETQRDA